MNIYSNIFERIKTISELEGYNSINDFALNALNYKASEKLNRLKNPNNKPSIDIIIDISNKFESVDLNWLINGVGIGYEKTKNAKNLTIKNGKENGKENGNKRNMQKTLPNHISMVAEPSLEYGPELTAITRKIKFAEGVQLTEFGAPFYPLPVSAGTVAELAIEEEKPTGYISIPGISVKAYFPVIGCSFEPLIRAGDIIGIDFIDKWEILDPDCIYYILTHDQRMIKRLMRHPEDKGKLICISPNYKEFPLDIAEISKVYKVVFYGRLV